MGKSTGDAMMLSVIICTSGKRERELGLLMEDIKTQNFPDHEVVLIKGVFPVGRARNLGIRKAMADIVLFLDDDARIDDPALFRKFFNACSRDQYSVFGAGRLGGNRLNFFQRLILTFIPRELIPPVTADTPSDLIATMCMGGQKRIFEGTPFDERITAGEDTKFRSAIRKKGFTTVLLANSYICHPPRKNIEDLIIQRIWYGRGISQLRFRGKKAPLPVKIGLIFYLALRFFFMPVHSFLPNLNSFIRKEEPLKPRFNPFYAFFDLFYAYGYVSNAV